MKMDFKDYYSTLGVAKTATQKEIKQAFRRLARKFHPDVNPSDKSAEAKFKDCLLYTSPSPRDRQKSRMPSSA